jgi:hypothetical protein
VADSAALTLLAASALHLGFQLTVSCIVYPALASEPESRWREAHDAHSRRITPVVVLVYGLLVVACGWTLATGPDRWSLVAVVAATVAGLLTALVAAPAHGRLGRAWSRSLLDRLLLVDRGRTVAAAVGALAAFLAAR